MSTQTEVSPTTPSSPPTLGLAGRRWIRLVLFASGACGLILQIVWQRVIAMNSGVDLAATITVVSTFLLGMGIGNLLGGSIADRVSPRSGLRVLALATAVLALYAWVASPLLYSLSRSLAPLLDSVAVAFAFNAAALLLPTVLIGTTLPLVARPVTSDIGEAGGRVGWSYSASTFGSAFGAFIGTWVLIGAWGFVGVSRLVAGVLLLTAAVLWMLAGWLTNDAPTGHDVHVAGNGHSDEDVTGEPTRWPIRRWYLIYALTGTVALGFEQVAFRLVDSVMRSNSYTFGHVLALFLILWGVGAAVGGSLVNRVSNHRRWFLWMQFAIGASMLFSLTLLVSVGPVLLPTQLESWFGSGGMTYGLFSVQGGQMLLFGLIIPTILLGGPALLFGASFPFAQSLVSQDMPSLGRSTGHLLFAGTVGNVLGTVVTGFVLLDVLGTAGSMVALAIPIMTVAILCMDRPATGRRLTPQVLGAATIALLVVAAPTNAQLWSVLTTSSPQTLRLAEDRACVTSLISRGNGMEVLQINGRVQNGYPFSDFHVMLGLLPALTHPDPERALIVGFGIGSTTYGTLASDRVRQITSVEICGGNYEVAQDLSESGAPELARVFSEANHQELLGDGRQYLLANPELFDLITPDTLLPQSASFNNLHSLEFMELISSRLRPDGMVAIWSASRRTINSVTGAFPYVLRVNGGAVDPVYESKILLGSQSPIDIDPTVLVERFDAIPAEAFPEPQRSRIRDLLQNVEVECFNDGTIPERPPGEALNLDLNPRDEYFITNWDIDETAVARTCG